MIRLSKHGLSRPRTVSRRVLCVVAGLVAAVTAMTLSAADVTAPNDVVIEALAIKESLTGAPGDAAAGREAFANRKLGNCLACHANADLKDQLFHGEVGPSLDGVASRWNEGQLRTIVVNAKAVFTDQTVMPGFYSLDVGADVRKDLVGKTILTAEQVEDIVAYLLTLN